MLNTLTLELTTPHATLGEIFDVKIDQKPLLDWFVEYEKQFSSSINGAYIPALNVKSIEKNLTANGNYFIPLACPCGEWECWYVTGQVMLVDDYVCWGNWCNPYRNDRSQKEQGLYWSYKDFPALTFSRVQYQQAIKNALGLLSQSP
ncbi:hypothetical protein [Paraglaciecola aestuariivivens]